MPGTSPVNAFYFVTEGIYAARERAKGKDVRIGGGAPKLTDEPRPASVSVPRGDAR